MRTIIIKCCFILLVILTKQLHAQSIQLRFPDTIAVNGTIMEVPVYADSSLTGKGIISYQFKIDCSSYHADVLDVIGTGTLSSGFGAPIYSVNPITNIISISSAGSSPLAGTGVLFKIRFQYKQAGGFYLSFTNGVTSNYVNQGSPLLTFKPGSVTINNPPVIMAYFANNAPLTVGDSVQVNVSGGTAPYTYQVLNPGVATITSTGMLKSVAAGKTKVRVESTNAIIDTTDIELEIRNLKLSLPDTTILPVSSVLYPVTINSTSGSSVLSGTFRIDYDPGYMVPDSVVLTNTLLAGKSVSFQTYPGYTIFSFATTTPLSGAGVLLNIRFAIINPFASGISIQHILFNQNIPANSKNGSIQFTPLPPLQVSPNVGAFFTNQTQLYIASGGKPPYTFSVTDTSKGSINAGGLFIAKRGGVVKVQVKDSLNAIIQTNNLQVYDAALLFPSISALPNAIVEYPVFLTNMMGGRSLMSFQVTVNFPANTLDSIQVILANGIASGWTPVQNVQADKVIIALAGTTPVNTNGLFFTIKAKVKSIVTLGSNISMTPTDVLFNESGFYAKLNAGNINIVSSLQKDIGINTYQNILSSCTKSNQEEVAATLYNYGNVTYLWGDSLFVGYKLNASSEVIDTLVLTNQLSQYQSLQFSFKTKANLALVGSYSIKVYSRLPGDINHVNDTATINFQTYGNPIVQLGNDTTICSGGNFSLNAFNTGSSYIWNTSATAASIIVDTSGSFSVKVTNGFNCSSYDTIVIVVHPKPQTSAISGATNVHVDTAETYSVINTVGSNYNWGVIGGIKLSGGFTNSIVVDWDSLYFGQVRVVETNTFGCKGDTVVLSMVSILPIQLVSFSGNRISDGVNLSWRTSSEENCDRFELERSLDAKRYLKIGEIAGSGTTNKLSSYTYLDGEALAIFTQTSQLYYRLKQVDFDGRFAYSNTIEVSDGKQLNGSLWVYPNPTSSTIYVKGVIGRGYVQDLLGNILHTFTGDGVIDMSGLEPGIYLLSSDSGKQKILKY
jgi:hypothetical protein